MSLKPGDTIGGLAATGRKLIGPASDLVELDSDNGLRHTAIVFHPEYRGHEAIGSALDVVLGFLESPMVTGLVELVGVDRDQGAFVYPTGEAWSVAEVTRLLADHGETAGVRAGLEVMYAAGQILVEAADAGENQGVYSHGGLTPWRVQLKRDGQILIIGHALPQIEILQFHQDDRRVPREDSFRYCPPERIEAAPEDLSSDLFGLALIAFEMMTGKPVYDGLVNDIRQQAARGEGSRRLFRFREVLPQSVRDVLTYALRPAREDRYPSGEEFLESVRAVLSSRDATGPSLMDVMARMSTQGPRQGTALEGGKTQMLSKEQLLQMLEEEDGPSQSSGDGVKGRSANQVWSPPPDRGGKRRPRRSRNDAEDGPEAQPTPAPQPEATAPAQPAAAPPSKWSKGPRRSRRGRGAEPEPEPPTAAAAPLPAPAAPQPPPAAAVDSGDRAQDLLNWIKSSADGDDDRPAADNSPAAGLIDKLTRSSGGNGAVAGGGAKFSKGRARRSRRTRGDSSSGDSPGVPEIPTSAGPRPGVAPPLIPSTPGVATAPVADRQLASTPLPKNAPKPAPAAASAAPVPLEVLKKPPRVEDAKDTTQQARPGDAPGDTVKAPVPPVAAPRTAPTAQAKTPAASAATARSALPHGATGFDRAPDKIPAVSSGDPVTLQLVRGEGGRAMRVRMPGDSSTAEAIARLVGNALPVRTDLSGGLVGWWRLQQDDMPLAGDVPVSALDADRSSIAVLVANHLITAEIHVPAASPPARMLARVGTAVPIVTLVDHLAGWLGLPAGDWQLSCDGRVLDAHMILADLSLGDGPALSDRPVLTLTARA